MSETMSPNPAAETRPAKSAAPRISEESATAQIEKLYEAFEAEIPLDKDGAWTGHAMKLRGACVRGRLEVNDFGDDVAVVQRFKRPVLGKTSATWNWSRLGMGKMTVAISNEAGVKPYRQSYNVAAPMLGIEVDEILKMHPADLSLVEDVSGFFQSI